MIDKSNTSLTEVLSQIQDGSTIMIGGFGTAGQPAELIDGLIELGVKDLVIVNNNAGNGDYGLAKLLKTGAVRKIICSFPRQSNSWVFDELYRAGKIELELVPQGNLACRIQAAGMGLGAVTILSSSHKLVSFSRNFKISDAFLLLNMDSKIS